MIAKTAPASRIEPSVPDTLRLGIRLVEDRLLEWTRSSIPYLEEGAHRLLRSGGKRFRPNICLASYLACEGAPFNDEVLDAAALVELIHTATLVHDDILDDADTRRGQPSAHRVYGANRALLLGDQLFATGTTALPRLPRAAQETILHASRLLAEGEAMEIELTRAGSATLEDYFVVISKKTAALVEACSAAGAICAGANPAMVEALAEFGFNAGVAFQLMDDLLDVEGVTELTGKPTHWDLSRGVPNAAVLATLEADLRGKPAPLTLPRGVADEMDRVLRRMAEIGGDERVRRLARMYGERALDALRRVPVSAAQRHLAREVESGLSRIS